VLVNDNHWLQGWLQDISDGVGAVVRVTAGGRTWTRVQDGGVHHRGQAKRGCTSGWRSNCRSIAAFAGPAAKCRRSQA
jgi:hypothetical protein